MKGRVNYTTKTTMEIEVDVSAQDALSGKERFTTKAYLTYVAVDVDGRPSPVPGLILDDDDSKDRFKVPVEILPFLAEQTIQNIENKGCKVTLRPEAQIFDDMH